MRRRLGTALAAAALAVTMAGCGGGDDTSPGAGDSSESATPSEDADSESGGERPSVADIATALQRDGNDITAEQADCAAQVLVDSDFSDETLTSLVAGDETIDGMASKEDLAALDTAGPKLVACYGLTG